MPNVQQLVCLWSLREHLWNVSLWMWWRLCTRWLWWWVYKWSWGSQMLYIQYSDVWTCLFCTLVVQISMILYTCARTCACVHVCALSHSYTFPDKYCRDCKFHVILNWEMFGGPGLKCRIWIYSYKRTIIFKSYDWFKVSCSRYVPLSHYM